LIARQQVSERRLALELPDPGADACCPATAVGVGAVAADRPQAQAVAAEAAERCGGHPGVERPGIAESLGADAQFEPGRMPAILVVIEVFGPAVAMHKAIAPRTSRFPQRRTRHARANRT